MRLTCLALGLCALLPLHLLAADSPHALDEFDAMIKLGEDRLIMGDTHGILHVYEIRDEGYDEVWTSEYMEGAISGLFIGDPDGDGQQDIVVYTETGRLHYLETKKYTTIWSNPPNEYDRITALTLANIDDDEQDELIFCADGRLIIYDGRDQFEEWRSDQTNIAATDIIVADVDGDDEAELVLNSGHVFDARFHDLEWQSPESFGERMGVIDLDDDGIAEIVGEFRGRFIRVFEIDLRREKSVKR
ncbi:MAG: hypothetical protein GKR89_17220 [Candidatus Latescibacteria bacterium]|nr:hypothetical protein [Candidatus Latescibacterota bacterium]